MTITTTDAEPIRRMLAEGKKVQQVADLTGWPRQRVTAVINGTKGWLLDPHTDTITVLTDQAPEPPREVPKPAPPPSPAAAKPHKPGPIGDAPVAELLTRALDLDDKTVQRLLNKTTEAIANLRQAVTAVETKAAAAREVAELERQLAAAKARLKGTSRRTTPAPAQQEGEVPARVVRAWALENGIECTVKGVVPKAVRDQYNAAHGITS